MTTNQVMVAVDDTHATTKEANEILGLIGAQSSAEKGQPNGIASLGADGKVPSAQLIAYDMLSELSASVVEHSGDGTLTIGAWNVLNGSAEYIASLPTAVGNTGKFIGVRTAANAFPVLLAPYSGETVYSATQGASTYGWYFCGSNSAVLVSDGTSWIMVEESRSVSATTSLAIASSEIASAFNKRIAALPRLLLGDITLQFADGTYTIDENVYLNFFHGGGKITLNGNTGESSGTKHTDQAVIFDSSALAGYTIYARRCMCQFSVNNIKVMHNTGSANKHGILCVGCDLVSVQGCYCLGSSVTYGAGMCISSCSLVYLKANYFSTHQTGIYALGGSRVIARDNDDTGTSPVYGAWAYESLIIGSATDIPSGSKEQLHRTNAGSFLPAREDDLTLSDVTTADASTTAHGFAPKAVAPASGALNVLGIANGETKFTNKGITGVAVSDATGAGDVVAQLNALLASLRATKIIAT